MATTPAPTDADLTKWVEAMRSAADPDAALLAAEPLLAAADNHRPAALELLSALSLLPLAARVDLAKRLDVAWEHEPVILMAIADCFEALTDIDDLNGAPPSDPWFANVVERLVGHARTLRARDAIVDADVALSTAARRLGRAFDDVAQAAHLRVLDTRPDDASAHYRYALFLKTRGRFAEGQRANETARKLGSSSQSTAWNLGICATGAGDGAAALAEWKQLGHHIELGRFDLPDGGFPMAKVRLAQRPLAERNASDDTPGFEENIYVQRLSACHGIVRCALLEEDIGVEYGDVVLFDGAPVGREPDGAPIFPHLATLRRSGYQTYWFVGEQPGGGVIADLSKELPDDAVFYVLTEQMVMLCQTCSMGRGNQSAHAHVHAHEERLRVRGKICAHPGLSPGELLRHVDLLVAATSGTRVLSPWLAEAAGLAERAAEEDAALDALLRTDE